MPHYLAVTGGRKFDDRQRVVDALELLIKFYGDVRVMHGDAPGADRLAAEVAAELGLVVKPFPADWAGPCDPKVCEPNHRRKHPSGADYCPSAGIRRNAHMVKLLERWRVSGYGVSVLAFPGPNGTADMIRRSTEADIAVSEL